ncbi:septum site-determining protein MinC [Vogesella sp. LIG4]|uniref:septum site-determining protein MinC n=1 Tax=Vogesella sp. LIG4 TaxID=1192162 RepID=UPI00081FB410|nr:septum site-determining protein MinC [Vogesella sp. LIG4]SCK17998.1 septum site-determining protein MinC [Vogesella sp. LIG4]
MSHSANLFDIKSASLDLLAILLRSGDCTALAAALDTRFGNKVDASQSEAFLLDLDSIDQPQSLDLARICTLFRAKGILIIALRHRDHAVAALARQHGLAFVSSANTPRQSELAMEAPAPAPVVEAAPQPANTLVIDRPVRAGQQIYAKGGDLVVLAMVNVGAEIIADGSIHVYAPLRGRALAGARGNTQARIFVQSMEAELVSIAGVYRTIEQSLPDSIQGKPAQIYLENERLVMSALGA